VTGEAEPTLAMAKLIEFLMPFCDAFNQEGVLKVN
jgi:hypothetical protein